MSTNVHSCLFNVSCPSRQVLAICIRTQQNILTGSATMSFSSKYYSNVTEKETGYNFCILFSDEITCLSSLH